MRVDIDGVSIELMGDPHLGKRFVNGVPLHRRGEREAMVRRDFEASLARASEVDLHVCLGDLFDRSVVSYETIAYAADAYLTAAHAAPLARLVVIAGNHDRGRDREAVTAFDIFQRLVAPLENVTVVKETCDIIKLDYRYFLFVPWPDGDEPTALRVHRWTKDMEEDEISAAFGHWDVDQRNGEHALIPTDILAEVTKRAFTGHDHKPRRFERDGVDVTVVGSLQPYAFGEEVDDKLYVTLPKAAIPDGDGRYWLKNKVVRIDLSPGEARDVDLDCLQLVYRSLGEAEEEERKVELGDFDLERLAGEVFAELGLEPATAAKVTGLISSTRMRK